MSMKHVYNQTVADGTATSVVRPSDWNSAHNLTYNLSGNTSGSSQVVGTDVVLVGGNNITLSADTLNSKLVIVAPNVQAGNVTISAGTTTGALGSIVFSNSNNVSFGLNGSTITGTASFAQSSLSFSNSNGVTFGTAGSTLTASINSTSGAGIGFTTTTTAGSLVAGTNDSNGLKLAVPAYLTTTAAQTVQPVAFSAGGGSSAFSTLIFSNSNNVSFTNNAGSLVASASFPAQTQFVLSNSNGITFGTNVSTVTASYNSTQFDPISATTKYAGTGTTFGGTNVSGSMTLNSNGLALSLSAQAPGGAASASLYMSGNTTNSSSGTMALSSMNISGSGIVSVGMSGNTLIISAPAASTLAPLSAGMSTGGNTTGTTGLASNQLVLAGGANITLSGSTNAGSMTISIVGGAGGGGGVAIAASNSTFTSGTVVMSNAGGALTISNGAQSVLFSVPATSSLSGQGGVTISTGGNTIYISAAGANPIFSAGTTSSALGSIVFSNSNGVGFGLNGSTITASYTVPTVTNSSWTVSDSATSGTVGRLAFTNLNGVTLSLSTGAGGSHTIVGSVVTTYLTSQSNQAFSASGGSSAFQTLSFGNSNGLTFSNSNGSVIASYTVPADQTGISGLAVSNTTFTSGTVTFSNSNNISFGSAGAGIITASYGGGAGGVNIAASNTTFTSGTVVLSVQGGAMTISSGAQSALFSVPATSSLSATGNASISSNASTISIGANAAAISIGGNSTSAGAGYSNVSTGTAVLFGGNNITLSQNGASITVSAANAGGAQTAISGIVVSNTTYTSGTVSFSNANGISFGSSAGQAITASYTVPTQTVQPVAVSGSNGSFAFSTLTMGNLNGLTHYTSNGSLVASYTVPTQTVQPVAFSASGGSSAFSTLVFTNSNGVTWTNTNGSIAMSYSVPSTAGLISALAVSGGAGTSTAATGITFQNSNSITFGVSTGVGGAASITASVSYPAQTNQSAIRGLGASNTGNTAGNTGISTGIDWVLAGSNNITISQSTVGGGPNTLWVSGPTVGGAQTGISTIAFPNTTFTSGGLTFTNSNGISFGSAAGGSITASYTVPTLITTLSAYALGNTTGQSSNTQLNDQTLSFSGLGNVSVGMSAGAIVISGAGGGGGVAIAASNSTFTSGTVVLSAAGGALTISNGAQSALFSVPATSSLVGVNGISIITNGSTISISNQQWTGLYFQPELAGATAALTQANGTLYIRPFEIDNYFDVDRIDMLQSFNSSRSTYALTASVSNASSSSGTGSWGVTETYIIFSRVQTNETAASYNSIISMYSNTVSRSAGYSASVSWNANVSSATASFSTSCVVGFPSSWGTDGGVTYSNTSSSTTSSFSSTSTNANSFSSTFIGSFPYAHISGLRPLYMPAGTNLGTTALPPGEYWLGLIQSSNTGSTNMSGLVGIASMSDAGKMYFTAQTNSYLEFGNSVAFTTNGLRPMFGSANVSSATTTNLALSTFSSITSNASLWFALDGKPK